MRTHCRRPSERSRLTVLVETPSIEATSAEERSGEASGWFGTIAVIQGHAPPQATPAGLSPQDLCRFLADRLDVWVNYFGPDREEPAGWLKQEWHHRIEYSDLLKAAAVVLAADPMAEEHQQMAQVRARLEPLLLRGLARRAGRFILPALVVRPEDLQDWQAWSFVRDLHEAAGGETADASIEQWGRARRFVVCDSCTSVFSPRRRFSGTARCKLCAKRPASPALGTADTLEMLRNGQPVTVRAARADTQLGLVTGWGSITLSRCAECGSPFTGKSGARLCGSSSCAGKHRRRVV